MFYKSHVLCFNMGNFLLPYSLRNGSMAVSYTHLDVYKRQVSQSIKILTEHALHLNMKNKFQINISPNRLYFLFVMPHKLNLNCHRKSVTQNSNFQCVPISMTLDKAVQKLLCNNVP